MLQSWSRTNLLVLGCILVGAGCGSSSSTPGNGGGTGGKGSGTGTAPTGGCPQAALKIVFSPMYSAYDGVHTFQVPAVVNGIDPTATQIVWSAADPSMVALQPDPTTGGVMITMQKSGNTTIYAQAGTLCGAAPLTITAATPDDWMAGSTRYNDGVTISIRNLFGGGRQSPDAGQTSDQYACTNCHGDTATGPYKDVAHTPEQTGGFSDTDLINIFEHGMVPQGGYFDTMILSYAMWQSFHKWDPGTAEKGLVVYLRSLTPAAQNGSSNFGGMYDGGVRGGRDGGFNFGDGGFNFGDGGFMPPDGGFRLDGGGFGMRDQ